MVDRPPDDQPCAGWLLANLTAVGVRSGTVRAAPGRHGQRHFTAPRPSTNRPPVGMQPKFRRSIATVRSDYRPRQTEASRGVRPADLSQDIRWSGVYPMATLLACLRIRVCGLGSSANFVRSSSNCAGRKIGLPPKSFASSCATTLPNTSRQTTSKVRRERERQERGGADDPGLPNPHAARPGVCLRR